MLRDVSFVLEPGSFTFLTGLSGAGKTTLLKLMYIAEPPSRGLITLFGKDLAARQASFEEEFRGESSRVRSAVKDLENDLNALKSKAYADVSEKLKIFEDEFFADLRTRRQDADEKFSTWRAEMDEHLSSSIREAEAARAERNRGAVASYA